MNSGLIYLILGLGIGGALTRILDSEERNKPLYAVLMVVLAAALLALKFYVKL